MNMYHVTYSTLAGVNSSCYVTASTEANAIAAASGADAQWKQMVSIRVMAQSVIVGS